MIQSNLRINSVLRLIFMFMMILVSGQAASTSGKLTIVNGDQNEGTVFTFSPHASQYNCFYHSENVLGEKHSVEPGGSFEFIVTNKCSGKAVQFSIYTKNQKRIAFKMHGAGSFQYITIGAAAGGYECKGDCLKYNAYNGNYSFTTNFVEAKPVAKSVLKLGQMKGKWEVFCSPGRQSCKRNISRSVTKGSETKDIRSKEVANAISQSLTLGIESEVKVAGSGSKVNFESTSSFEHSSAITTAKEISSSQQNTKTDSDQVDVDYKEYDVAVVWRWILTAKTVGNSDEKVTLKTNDYTCTSGITPPSYLPYSPEHVANPCLKKR